MSRKRYRRLHANFWSCAGCKTFTFATHACIHNYYTNRINHRDKEKKNPNPIFPAFLPIHVNASKTPSSAFNRNILKCIGDTWRLFDSFVLSKHVCCYAYAAVCTHARHALMDQIGFTDTDHEQYDGSRWVVIMKIDWPSSEKNHSVKDNRNNKARSETKSKLRTFEE